MVDVDYAELEKPTLSLNQPIHADLAEFISMTLAETNKTEGAVFRDEEKWLQWCRDRVVRYPVVLPEYWESKEVNPYCFVDSLFEQLDENEKIVTGDGTACVATFQAAKIKKGQRLYTNSGCAAMGYDLPAAIGAYRALTPRRLICITGDGSIQMNLQELQTILQFKMNIKLFVLNNRGYHSIRQTQQNYFPDNIVGCGVESGLSFPEITRIGDVYGFETGTIWNHDELEAGIKRALDSKGPYICEVILDLNQQFAPKLSSRKLSDGRMVSSPLEDLAPFLSRDELAKNMIVPLWED
jgi:acetolactate synthase-1/2/3 large subunit